MRFPLWVRTAVLAAAPSALFLVFPASAAPPQSGTTPSVPQAASPSAPDSALANSSVSIAGPVRSFMRMAGISQKASNDEVLALLARNVMLLGYDNGRPTEFLILLERYVGQARELALLAGPGHIIRVTGCGDAAPLLKIIGFRIRQECGQKTTSLITSDADRAFITTDSGFPLWKLEATLQGESSFEYPYSPTIVPAILAPSDWIALARAEKSDSRDSDVVDVLIHSLPVSRLYWALSRNDPETRAILARDVGLAKLLPFGKAMDLYGSQLGIHEGVVRVPGGTAAENEWKELVGASPRSPGEFAVHLYEKDHGWLAAYFDALFRTSAAQQERFLEGNRLKRYYDAFRSPDPDADAAASLAFRQAPALLPLVTRLQWDSNGQPHVPGNLAAWSHILGLKSDSKIIRNWGKRSRHLQNADQLIQAMFAISRVQTDGGPLQSYLFLSELDSRRPANRKLSPRTVLLMAADFAEFSQQYQVFCEFPALSDGAIAEFLHTAKDVGSLSDHTLRGNAMGIFEANIGMWQILARQGQISAGELNASFNEVLKPFANLSSASELFDAGRTSLQSLVQAATGSPQVSQGELVALLAGPRQTTQDGRRMHQQFVTQIDSIMAGQRLVNLDTLLGLDAALNDLSKGVDAEERLAALAGELHEFEMPQPIFTGSERVQWAAGTYNNRHTDIQMRTDLMKTLKAPRTPAKIATARGQLAPFLRDTLVGFNYAYYEPPGAQILYNNPLFVRSHDFSGDTVIGYEHRVWQAPELFGAGSPAGGGAHLIGSLADLPFVLAQVEQDFISPENVQALIWKQFVPGLLTNATLPRWWDVSRDELHAVALYQRAGEELLTASVHDADIRAKVLGVLSDRMVQRQLAWLSSSLAEGHMDGVFTRLQPADTFYLTAEFRRRYPQDTQDWGAAGRELSALLRKDGVDLSWEKISHDFGVPHPALAGSYSLELLNLKPYPPLGGYCNRLMAESWDSSNLYWARLADEAGYPTVLLNQMVPEMTRLMVEKIFASELEDWPAILRAMHEAGNEFRAGKVASLAPDSTSPRP